MLAGAFGLPGTPNGFDKINDRQLDVQKRQANATIDAYTTVFLTDTATDTFTDILTDSIVDTATAAIITTMEVIPSLSGAADSGVVLSPPTSGPPNLSFTGAADSGVPFAPPNATSSSIVVTYSSGVIALPPSSLITAAPSSTPTNEVCVLDPLLTDFLSVSMDASSFCSSFISIPMYTETSNIATSMASVHHKISPYHWLI